MGRPRISQPPVPASFIAECFTVSDGALIWRERPASHFSCRSSDHAHFNAIFAGKEAGFIGPVGIQIVRFMHENRTRRMTVLKVGWILATGQHPKGQIKARDGNERNVAASNLIEIARGHDPYGALSNRRAKGGKASSLERRRLSNAKLLEALVANPNVTVPVLSRLVGSSAPCTCVRLSGLADAGLCVGPRCDSRARWDATPAGRELAMRGIGGAETEVAGLILDQCDKDILMAIARAPARLMSLSRTVDVCPRSIRRRADALVTRGLVEAEAGRCFKITDNGRALLGLDAAPAPWVRREAVAASTARDVVSRIEHFPNDNRSASMRSRQGHDTAQKAAATTRLRKTLGHYADAG